MAARGAQRRGIFLALAGLVIGSAPVALAHAAGVRATIERYDPAISGDRVVFTEVERSGTSTKARLVVRDLRTRIETTVADIAIGEPAAELNDRWVVWSEQLRTKQPTAVVRARGFDRNAKVFDVLRADVPPFFGPQTPAVALDGDTVATVPLAVPDGTGTSTVARVSLPNRQTSSVAFPFDLGWSNRLGVAGDRTLVSNTFQAPFFVADANGGLVVAPAVPFDCSPSGQAAISGDLVATVATCFDLTTFTTGAAVLSCRLPCDAGYARLALPSGFSGAAADISLSGSRLAWGTGFGGGVYTVDLATGDARVVVGSVGANRRVRVSGQRIVWDGIRFRDATPVPEIYLYDAATGTTTVLASGATDEVLPTATGPIRLAPDLRGRDLAFTEVSRTDGSASIWVSRPDGSNPSLVSRSATPDALVGVGRGWLAWTSRAAPEIGLQVWAARTSGGVATSIFPSDSAPGISVRPFQRPDLTDSRVSIFASEQRTDPVGTFSTDVAAARALPDGPISVLHSADGRDFSFPRMEGRWTVGQVDAFGRLSLYDGTKLVRTIDGVTDSFGNGCRPQFDVSETHLIVVYTCDTEQQTFVTSCALPCASGLAPKRALPPVREPFSGRDLPPDVRSVNAAGSTLVYTTATAVLPGRDADRSVLGTAVLAFDTASQQAPRLIGRDNGVVSDARIDGPLVVWSVDRTTRGRSGEIVEYNLNTSTSITF